MSIENLKTLFQILIYIGTSISIFGAILINTNPDDKIKWAFNIQMGSAVVIVGAIFILISTILFDSYSSKAESKKQKENDKQLAERDEIINQKTEQLTLAQRFNSEINDPVNSMYLIFDLDTILGNQFDNFSCILQFKLLNVTVQVKSIKTDESNSNNYYYQTSIVNGKDIRNSPHVFNSTGSNETLNRVYINLLMLTHYLPEGFTLKDFNNKSFYIFLTERQTQIVKRIGFNANNWNIYNINKAEMSWQDMKQDWLPENMELKVLHRIDKENNLTNTDINYFENPFSYSEIKHSYISSDKRIDKSYLDQILSSLNENSGTIVFGLDTNWRIKNNRLIEYLPKTTANGMTVRVFRDIDNILKIEISYKHAKDLMLTCKYPENIVNRKENDLLAFAWNEEGAKLFINGNEIDRINLNNK